MNKMIFDEISLLLAKHGYTDDRDVFKVLLEYQSQRLNDLETAVKDQQYKALRRTAMYSEQDMVFKWAQMAESTKTKNLFKAINLLCLAYSDLNDNLFDEKSAYHGIFKYAVENKEKILDQREWYLNTMPESQWLIEYLEQKQQ